MNSEQVKQKLQKKFEKVIFEIDRGIFKGLSVFYSKIVKEQMSNRPGLRRRSGNLAKGWFVEKKGELKDREYILRNREWYGLVHQHDKGFEGNIRAKNKKFLHFFIGKKEFFMKQVFIPKRLTVYETFKEIGNKLISNSIKQRLDKLLKPKE